MISKKWTGSVLAILFRIVIEVYLLPEVGCRLFDIERELGGSGGGF